MPKQVPKIEIHDESARIVKGFGTVDIFDKAGERLPIDEFKRIMPIIMKRGGIIMNRHTNQTAGRILNYDFRMKQTNEGPKEGVYLTTEVFKDFASDDETWDAIKKGETEGFSFGGRNNAEELDFSKGLTQKVLKQLEGFEFSYVPKGMNQEATIEEVNYIAKEAVNEEGETSQDNNHYHLYRIDADGNGGTLGTLPREAEDHTHSIKIGVVQIENNHDHKLIRELVERTKKAYEENPKNEKKENTDDKTLSKSVHTLNTDGKKADSFINDNSCNKTMAEEKIEETKKVEEVPQANSETPVNSMEAKLDQIISLLSGVQKAEEDKEKKDEEDKDKDKVDKEGDGEKVKLPESEGDEVSQDKPAEGAKNDEAQANFLAKEKEAMKEEVKKEIMKELLDKRADTPRAGVKANDVQKADEPKDPKTWMEANKMIRKQGRR